jgi:hypothetical protein
MTLPLVPTIVLHMEVAGTRYYTVPWLATPRYSGPVPKALFVPLDEATSNFVKAVIDCTANRMPGMTILEVMRIAYTVDPNTLKEWVEVEVAYIAGIGPYVP